MAFKPSLSLKVPDSCSTSSVRVRPWHAVEIVCPADACEAACEAKGHRYLATEAPLLPLKGCDQMDRCHCRYRHHEDRRRGPRRRSDGAPPDSAMSNTANRRRMDSRREDDAIPDDFYAEGDDSPSLIEDTYYDYVRKRPTESESE